MSRRSVWDILGIERGDDERAIRRAYAARLKATHPEDDAEGFQRLREAYEVALDQARWRRFEAEEDAGEAGENPAPVAPPPEPPAAAHDDPRLRDLVEDLRALQKSLEDGSEELERLLKAEPFDKNAAYRQLKALFASPALLNIDLAVRFEPWVERVLLAHLPNADALIPMAIRNYGWTRADGYRPYQTGDAALARDEDLVFVRRVTDPSNTSRAAWMALSQPFKASRTQAWRTDGLLQQQVAELLRIVETERPGLRINLSEEAVAWWTSAAGKPRMLPETIWAWAGVPLAVAFVALSVRGLEDAPAWTGLLTVGAPLGAGIGALWAFQTRGRLAEPADSGLIRWGWAPGAIALLLVAAVAAGAGWTGPWVTALLALFGIGLAFWAARVAEPDRGPDAIFGSTIGSAGGTLDWPWGGLLRIAPLGVFWAFLPLAIDFDAWRVLGVALLGAMTTLSLGLGSLSAAFRDIGPKARQGVYLAGAAAIAGIAALLAFLGLEPVAQAWGAALVAGLTLLSSAVDGVLTRDQRLARTGMMLPALFIFWVALQMATLQLAGALRINGIWLLAGVAMTLWHAMQNDAKAREPKAPRVQFD